MDYTHRTLALTEAENAGMFAGVLHSQLWETRVGFHAPLADDLEERWGIRPITFSRWARANLNAVAGPGDR